MEQSAIPPLVQDWLTQLAVSITCLLLLGTCVLAQPVAQPAVVQLPTLGVSIDAEGLLAAKVFSSPVPALAQARRLAVEQLPAELKRASPQRKLSLRRLLETCAALEQQGLAISDELQYLAGLQRVEYVFAYPDRRDIVVAGPAEGWVIDASGRAVGVTNGRPILRLEDLLTALRTCGFNQQQWVGCSIDPTREALTRLARVNHELPRAIPVSARQATQVALDTALREALGVALIRVFGIPADSHMGLVLVEAD